MAAPHTNPLPAACVSWRLANLNGATTDAPRAAATLSPLAAAQPIPDAANDNDWPGEAEAA